MFYEDLGEYEKSYQLSLIAAYLSPQDADEWLRLAEVPFVIVLHFSPFHRFSCNSGLLG